MASGVELRLLEVGHCRHPEWVTMRGGAWSACRFPSLCVLILHPQAGPILYDTGYAERFDEATSPIPERFYRWLTPVTLPPHQHLLAQLRACGVEAADIRLVLISHLHADHVAGLRDLPRARFVALRAEIDSVRGLGRIAGLRRAFLPALLPDDFEARLDYADDHPLRALGSEWAPFNTGFDLLGDGVCSASRFPVIAPANWGWLCGAATASAASSRPTPAGRREPSANAGCRLSSRGR
jgi:hypothetical protein